MIRHFLSAQFLRFLAVGATAAAVNWLARIILSLWLPFAATVALAYAAGIAVAFLLNLRFVFPQADRPRHLLLRDFIAVNALSFPLVWLTAVVLLALFTHAGWTWHAAEIAHAIALALPVLAVFLVYKLRVFSTRP
jgi:putative flippase GtrA